MHLPHKIVQNLQFLFIFSIVSPFGQQTQLLKVSTFSFRNVKDFQKIILPLTGHLIPVRQISKRLQKFVSKPQLCLSPD